jgi:hypothetical protein
MKKPTRREFIGTAVGLCAATQLISHVNAQTTGEGAKSRARFPRGYLLVQELGTYNTSRFGCISTASEAEEILSKLDGRLDALEFSSPYFDAHDLRVHEAVARVGVAHKVDLWMSTFRMAAKVRSFGEIRREFQAHVMEANGSIVPAEMAMSPNSKPAPLLDVLNPEAVDWFLVEFRKRYLEPMKGLLAGLFFNEDCLPYVGVAVNNRRFDYWRNATFSPRVLTLWREYCRNKNVIHRGQLMDKFPVHDPQMVANGGGMTMLVPGWNVPASVEPGQRFAELPKVDGIWKHWTDFTCEQYLQNWIGRLAQLANEVNRDVSQWKGVMYFGLHYWSLPYEQIANPQFSVPKMHCWGAWGRQRGVDLERLAAHPEIDCVVCETYPPIEANLTEFVAEYARITREAGKTFGVMLHRDDKWQLKLDEEKRRWDLIARAKPTVISRYPSAHMLPGNEFYSAEGEKLFAARLAQYKQAGR